MNTNRSSKTRVALLAAVLLVAAASGCGFFDTRNPIEVTPISIPRENPTTPQNVMFNYWNAVRYGLTGLTQYEETLDDGFGMFFDISDSLELGVGSIGHDQAVEAFRLAASAGQDSILFVFEEQDPELGANTAFYSRIPYEGAFLSRQADTLAATWTFSGTADIRLQTDNVGNWVLRSWHDYRDVSSDASWGRILGEQVSTGKPGEHARIP